MTREQARKMLSSLADANGKKHIIKGQLHHE